MRPVLLCLACFLAFCLSLRAQDPNATVSGRVLDPSGAVVSGTQVRLINDATNIEYSGVTNDAGIYSISSIPPGKYHIQVSKNGFKNMVKPDVILHVQDALTINFTLEIGAGSESVTVEGGAPLINTESAAVGTVVDRQFAENLPLNGRSFQSLIELAPGVVVIPTNPNDTGQFSVNGQRGTSNYWMVDGVSANVGISAGANGLGNALGGSLGSFSALGGTNSLVSVDALQEFRIQTSTYAPEFGRTPGAQISILTRSGTNQFHGTLFDYLRNDVLDANDWFANAKSLPKPRERQNDFGGTFSGPILKDKTFFFFSYEGLRLRLPQVGLTRVPDLSARQNAIPAVQPFMNAFPLPNGPDNLATGVAQFNASFSNKATLDAYSLRVDHRLSQKLTLFGRYNYSPSEIVQRGASSALSLSELLPLRITTQTGTVGTTWVISSATTNDLRLNYSRTNGSSSSQLDTFGGAVPPTAFPLPTPFTVQNATFGFFINSLGSGHYVVGHNTQNLQQQFNIVESLSAQRGSHSLKFGVDFRRLSPTITPQLYSQQANFATVPKAESGSLSSTVINAFNSETFLFHNLGVFAQDTWRALPRVTLTYGLRWDLDFAPSTTSGPNIPAVTGFNLNDLSNLALEPMGTAPFSTTYGNVAPRLGVAYQLSQSQDWQTVFRGGFGMFFDLATSEVGNSIIGSYPFQASKSIPSGTFPLNSTTVAPPPITPASLSSSTLAAIDPHLELPYTLEWNVALEQALGRQQTITASYIGSSGRRLLQTGVTIAPNSSIGAAQLVTNAGTSNYNALQLQFQRRVSRGLQLLTSYTWSHSIDTGSAGSATGNFSNLVSSVDVNANRGPSDFDIRNSLSAAVTYDVPAPKVNALVNAFLHGWSIQSVIHASSAPPVTVIDVGFFQLGNVEASVRPDVVPGQPLYLYGANCASAMQGLGIAAPGQGCPGGKGINPAAFMDPPTTPPGCNPFVDFPCNPARQGNLGRNAVRSFGATQWDFAVHRDFAIRESVKLQFRAEMFNVLNHPNFGPLNNQFLSPANFGPISEFGLSTQTLGQSLSNGTVGGGGFNPLYQIGGPRSVQLGLKLFF